MIGQHLGQQRPVGEQRLLADAEFTQQGRERGVGRREDGERSRTLQGVHQTRSSSGLDERAEVVDRLGGLNDVLVRRQQHLVEDVDDAIVGHQVGPYDARDPIAAVGDRQCTGVAGVDLEVAATERPDRPAERNIGLRHRTRQHVIGQHLGEQRLVGEQRVLADAELREQCAEGRVGRREDRERTGTGQGLRKAGRRHRLGQQGQFRIRLRHLDRAAGGRARTDGGPGRIVAAAAGGQQGGKEQYRKSVQPSPHVDLQEYRGWKGGRRVSGRAAETTDAESDKTNSSHID